jgi:ribosome-associated protein
LTSEKFAKLIADFVQNKKGYEIKILDLRKLSSITDFFVICSADSDRQVKAIADEVDEKLSTQGIKCFHREGYETLNWILLDYFDVILHVFKAEARNYYNLEKFWGDAPIIEVKDEDVQKPNVRNKTKSKK